VGLIAYRLPQPAWVKVKLPASMKGKGHLNQREELPHD